MADEGSAHAAEASLPSTAPDAIALRVPAQAAAAAATVDCQTGALQDGAPLESAPAGAGLPPEQVPPVALEADACADAAVDMELCEPSVLMEPASRIDEISLTATMEPKLTAPSATAVESSLLDSVASATVNDAPDIAQLDVVPTAGSAASASATSSPLASASSPTPADAHAPHPADAHAPLPDAKAPVPDAGAPLPAGPPLPARGAAAAAAAAISSQAGRSSDNDTPATAVLACET